MKNLGIVIVVLMFIGLCIWLPFRNTTTETHTIQSINKVEATEGDSDGFYTRVYYLVSTDKGAYQINTIGFNAAPECVSIKTDSTYILTTRGTAIPYLGVYKNIIKVE